MIEKFLKNSNFQTLRSAIEDGHNCSVFGLNKGEKIALLEDSAFLFYVTENLDGVEELRDLFSSLGRSPEVLCDYLSPLSSPFESFQRILEILRQIKSGKVDTLILTPNMLMSRFPSYNIEDIVVNKGDELDVTKFVSRLVTLGYKRVELVAEKGEFSVRGDVVDIYPLDGAPTRIMTDFDIVDSIRAYNPISLMTTSELSQCIVPCNTYYSVSNQDIEDVYSSKGLRKDDLFYELTSLTDVDYRCLAFDKNFQSSIFDFVPDGVIAFDGAKAIYDNLLLAIDSYNSRLKESELNKICDRISISDLLKFSSSHTLVAFHYIQQNNRIFSPQKVFNIRTLPAVNYVGHNNVLLLDIGNYYRQGYTIILCAGTTEGGNRLQAILSDGGLKSDIYPRISMAMPQNINIVIRKYPLDVILPEDKLVIVSYNSLFGKPKRIIESADTSYVDGEIPSENDYVVHSVHGIGRCLGVKTLNLSSSMRDYVVIEYKNNDKVYLPVENLNQLSKYVGSDKAPAINKIGGVEFARTKAKIKSAVKKIAFDLMALYRDRMDKKGIKYLPDDQLQKDFEITCGFNETADQVKAIDDCKKDMEGGKVMDRLVCGDVGFGKTEVALRIAFKTILNGKQVAFLCPTTILSEQHYNTAKSRMSNFGVKIDVLNRLRSKFDEDRIKKDFSSGKIDMICGTHKLLSSDIDYKNLGLLILDEEQKFGVADKEKIKNMRKNVNVLTLSATPIPRTLNMSLIGVRDISLIETPPMERIASDVQVVEYSDILVKNAILRELERHGQVLVIYNRVEKIYNFASKIKNLCPDAVVSVAHGQMDEKELEREILALYSGKTQVLVATTLIENGVDLPNANTLIVINSDMLGLSQLYQLKGRIGRSDRSSYAYFTFDNRKVLTENACKRLQAIKEFSTMGSGFKIAMRDLEIRGAGSLLGAEQSGHIEKVGYNMYVSLLNESVKELKGESMVVRSDIRVETNLPAFLSHDYIENTHLRMAIYREISNIDTIEKLEKFWEKTTNVYGEMPIELDNLIKIALIKNRLSLFGVERVILKSVVKIIFDSRESLNGKIIDAINSRGDNAALNISEKPIVELKISNTNNILKETIEFISYFDTF